jgi:general secretion pathway protein H
MSRAGAASGPSRSRRGGFTLLEMLVVMLLLGLLTAVAAPRFAALREPSLRDVGRGVVAELRARRAAAMRSGRPVAASAASIALPPGFALLPGGGEEEEGAAASAAGLFFLPDGRSTGGRMLLARGTDRALVTVDWLTGEVRLGGATP